MHRRPLLALLALPGLAPSGLARAQQPAWPARPIRLVVPYGAGGQSDTVARLVAQRMGAALSQPLVVENRTGAGGAIGAGLVAQAPADGYTLLFESFTFVVAPFIHHGLPFDYETAFAPIGQAVSLPYVLVVKRDLPVQDLAGFVAHARANPGLTYGSPGIGTTGHLAGALLAQRAGIRLEHVSYRGGAEAARDLAAGAIDAAISSANSLKPLVDEGRARGMALTSAEQRGTLARLPPIAALYPGFDLPSWNGFFAPAATPAPVVARLEAALREALADPAVVQRLAGTGNDAMAGSAAAFAERIARDRAVVRRLVQETGLKVE